MCGIAGYFSTKEQHHLHDALQSAITCLNKRGPDLQRAEVLSPHVGLAHARLSIIDTSEAGNQPMKDSSGRYTIVFNGEIFNYQELKNTYLAKDNSFNSTSDTEVLLHLYIQQGASCLEKLNGFFAFAIYDSLEQTLFLARDRFGIKPLHIYTGKDFIVFGSELKALYSFPFKKEIDLTTLALYLQLNYIPGNNSILKGVSKLQPGHYVIITKNGDIKFSPFYTIPYTPGNIIGTNKISYDDAKAKLRQLVDEAVQRRLVSDVPLGAFLSGGIDSSIVVSSAAKHKKGLHTYSIGFKDEPYFDETKYANLVAKKFGTEHTVFSISNDEMFDNLHNVLDYIDEPFADSSALAVYILSNYTRKHVTVSLSGDGGDELFAGYNKHKAEQRARNSTLLNTFAAIAGPIAGMLPKSRQNRLGNLIRQVHRYAEGAAMSNAQRYWRWALLSTQEQALNLFKNKAAITQNELEKRKEFVLKCISEKGDLNDVLYADTQMVLPNDMLTKVDLMSMANSLEVRVPLLDYTVVNFAFSLPVEYKIKDGVTKRILKDAFRNDLPEELFTRPKHGFEVPLLKWMRTGLRALIENDLLSADFVESQGIFDVAEIEKLKQKLFSVDPGDIHARIWGLIVFQYWYKKYYAPHA
jgi:asparagine synthase (glutamine-hydrolysing)